MSSFMDQVLQIPMKLREWISPTFHGLEKIHVFCLVSLVLSLSMANFALGGLIFKNAPIAVSIGAYSVFCDQDAINQIMKRKQIFF